MVQPVLKLLSENADRSAAVYRQFRERKHAVNFVVKLLLENADRPPCGARIHDLSQALAITSFFVSSSLRIGLGKHNLLAGQ